MLSLNQNHDVNTIDRNVFGAIDRRVMGSHRVLPHMLRLGKRLYSQWSPAKEQTPAITAPTTGPCPAASARTPLPAAAWASLVLGAALST